MTITDDQIAALVDAAGEETPGETLPCPFCGAMPTLREIIEHYAAEGEHPAGSYTVEYSITCDECGACQADEYRGEAVGAWNRRANPATILVLAARVQALEAALKPFAAAGVAWATSAADDDAKVYSDLHADAAELIDLGEVPAISDPDLTVGDFRRAALASPPVSGEPS